MGRDDVGWYEKWCLPGHVGSALEGQVPGEKLRLLHAPQESQLLTGVGCKRNRQCCCVWVGAHVCLTANIPL